MRYEYNPDTNTLRVVQRNIPPFDGKETFDYYQTLEQWRKENPVGVRKG